MRDGCDERATDAAGAIRDDDPAVSRRAWRSGPPEPTLLKPRVSAACQAMKTGTDRCTDAAAEGSEVRNRQDGGIDVRRSGPRREISPGAFFWDAQRTLRRPGAGIDVANRVRIARSIEGASSPA